MKITQLKLPGMLLIEPDIFQDHRGRFAETYRSKTLTEAAKINFDLVQYNLSFSNAWTLRGMHYQYPNPQGKLVRVVHGKVQDVAVDLREGSPTYGKYQSVMLDDILCRAVWVPPGFAHGFLALDQGATVTYECSSYYSDEYAKELSYNDPDIGILWSIPIGRTPLISNKDRAAPGLSTVTPMIV